jgi:hypothetical protein
MSQQIPASPDYVLIYENEFEPYMSLIPISDAPKHCLNDNMICNDDDVVDVVDVVEVPSVQIL